ncbi:MAG: hypothetical protein KGJ93_00075 [Patescibacteria group bacterium]|nr:hypothetical protein [Patescibacteria group bacterium]
MSEETKEKIIDVSFSAVKAGEPAEAINAPETAEVETVAPEPKAESKVNVKGFRRRRRARVSSTLIDYGDFRAFEATKELDIRGKKVQVPDFRIIVNDELINELVKRRLLKKEDQAVPAKIEQALRPLLDKVLRNNWDFDPKDLRVEGRGDNMELVMQMDKRDMRVPFADARMVMKNVLGQDNGYLNAAYEARKNPRYYQKLKKYWNDAQFQQFKDDFQNISNRSLKTLQETVSAGKNWEAEYLAAKELLVKEGAAEGTDSAKLDGARELVRAVEDVVLQAGVPNYRDTILHQALLERLKNYEQIAKRENEDLLTKVLAEPESYPWSRLQKLLAKERPEAKAQLYSQLLNSAGVYRSYRWVEDKAFVKNGQDPEKWPFPLKRPRNFLSLSARAALEVLQRQSRQPEYELPPTRFFEQAVVTEFAGSVPELRPEQQPAVVIQEESGKGFLRLYLKHPKKADETRRFYLPIGGGGLLRAPEQNDAHKFYEAGQHLFEGRNSFNLAITWEGGDDSDPVFSFAAQGLGGQVKKRLSELQSNLDFGSLLESKICVAEFLAWKKREKTEGRAKLDESGAYNRELTTDQRNQIGRMTGILSYRGIPSLGEQLIAEHISKVLSLESDLTRQASLKRRVKIGGALKTEAAVAERQPVLPEIKYSSAETDFIKELVYSEVPSGSDFMSASELQTAILAKAQEFKLQPAALTLRLLKSLENLLAGQKQILSRGIGDLELAKQFKRQVKLSPEESLEILVKGLRAALRDIAVSGEVLPSERAVVFAESLEQQGLSSPELRRFCASQYDVFMDRTDPSKPLDSREAKFRNFWQSLGQNMAQRAAVSRQLGGGEQTKLIS